MTFTEKAQKLMEGCGDWYDDDQYQCYKSELCPSCERAISTRREDLQDFQSHCIGIKGFICSTPFDFAHLERIKYDISQALEVLEGKK